MRVAGIIPARYGSTRLPGKPLLDIGGKPMVQWVYEVARETSLLERVIVATDDRRIVEAVEAFGGEAWLTSTNHRSGTDRVVEVAAQLDAEIIVNIQVDEPLLEPQVIDLAVAPLFGNSSLMMVTVKSRADRVEDLFDPHIVKVITDREDYALYFSRLPLPFIQQGSKKGLSHKKFLMEHPELLSRYYRHIGLYVYRKEFLMSYARWGPSPLEELEELEQLRVLENGHRIKVITTECSSRGIDTPRDLHWVKERISKGSSSQLI